MIVTHELRQFSKDELRKLKRLARWRAISEAISDWVKRRLAFFTQLLHRHSWGSRYLDLPRAVWPFKAPYLEICDCGATRLAETRQDD